MRAWKHAANPKPYKKEILEAFAVFRKCKKLFRAQRGDDVVCLEVAAGHGILSLLHLCYKRARRAVLVDISQPASFLHMFQVWKPFMLDHCSADFHVEDMLDTLPGRLEGLRKEGASVVTLGVHACNSDFVITTCVAASVDFCVVPCCHQDKSPGKQLTAAARASGQPVGVLLDVITIARLATDGYRCDFRVLAEPPRRVLIGSTKPPQSMRFLHKVKSGEPAH